MSTRARQYDAQVLRRDLLSPHLLSLTLGGMPVLRFRFRLTDTQRFCLQSVVVEGRGAVTIVDAATKLFLERGFDAFRMEGDFTITETDGGQVARSARKIGS